MLTSSLTCLLTRSTLAEELERTLLGLVASREEELLGGLGAERMLAAADNPAVLILHQIPLCQATRCLISGAVPYLCFRAYCHFLY